MLGVYYLSEGFKVCLEFTILAKDSRHAWSYYFSEGFKVCLEFTTLVKDSRHALSVLS